MARPDLNDPFALDAGTAERLLERLISIDDAPPRYREVALVMTALAAPATARETSREWDAVQSISRRIAVQAASSSPARKTTKTRGRRRSSTTAPMKHKVRLLGAAFVGSAFVLSGLGAAGALPGAAQTVASEVWSSVGVSVPNPDANTNSPVNVDTNVGTGESHTLVTGGNRPDTGSSISNAAQDPSLSGVDKGAAISGAASDGQSHAGENTPGAPSATKPPHPDKPTTANNADNATNGNSQKTGTGADNSDGNSTAGSANGNP